MKYDPKKRCLYKENGDVLKRLNCPLNKSWDSLVYEHRSPYKRYCNSCSKYVIDISEFTEHEVETILKLDRESCVCIRGDSKHIEWEFDQPGKSRRIDKSNACSLEDGTYDGCKAVKTARDGAQIFSNDYSYQVIIKQVEIDPIFSLNVEVAFSKKGYRMYDSGCVPENSHSWFPLKSLSPYAAYLVPKDVEPGEKVYVLDIIENFVASYSSQGVVTRVESGFGIFTGEDIEFDYQKELPDYYTEMG